MIDNVDSWQLRRVRCGAMSFTPAASLTYLVQKVAVKALNALEESFDDLGITARHYIVLGLASDPDQPSQAVIAGKLGVDATVLGRMLDELEQRELVVRQRATDDRRRHELVLTKAGRETLADRRGAPARCGTPVLRPPVSGGATRLRGRAADAAELASVDGAVTLRRLAGGGRGSAVLVVVGASWWRVPSGRRRVMVRSGFKVRVQPPSWTWWWCRSHSGNRLSRFVAPRCSHQVT